MTHSFPTLRSSCLGADQVLLGRYRNGEGREADLAIAVYARQGEGRELVGFGQGAVAPGSAWAWSPSAPAPAHAHGEHIVAPGPVTRDVVSFYTLSRALTGRAADSTLQTLKPRLTWGDRRAVAALGAATRIDKKHDN